MNKNFTSDKIKHVLIENESNELSKKVKGISAKRLKKYLIDKFNIANGPKYFSSGIFQNYLVFVPGKTYIKNLVALLGLIRGNLMEFQKKKLKI